MHFDIIKSYNLMNISLKQLVAIFLLAIVIVIPNSSIYAAITAEKTPSDVYQQVQLLKQSVQQLRLQNNIAVTWPKVIAESGREPRHVFQKALEILIKINKYRVNIAKVGGISVPNYSGRDITPNEVFELVIRLEQELALLLKRNSQQKIRDFEQQQAVNTLVDKTPSDVYAALSEVSMALEETLGLRGITPSEVFMRSQQVVNLSRFLRMSQGMSTKVIKPPRTQGKLPNHALQAVHQLLDGIRQAELNLWMKPLQQSDVPKRVITPSDVYDAMGVVMAELQRIQYRLGLERIFPEPELNENKTPDDVIQNTQFARAILPTFELDKPLLQYDRIALIKTPNDVYSVTEHILKEMELYRRLLGIKVVPRKARIIQGLKPPHVYGKVLEIMEKIDVLRRRQNMGPIAVPHYPLRTITPSEVYDLTLRLDDELGLIYEHLEMEEAEEWLVSTSINEYEDKKPSDVFYLMQKISNLLDTILGTDGFSPNEVFREVIRTKEDVQMIARNLGHSLSEEIWKSGLLKPETEPRDVLAKSKEVLDLIVQVKRRAGMFGVNNIAVTPTTQVTPSDVFNQVRLIETELTEFKVFLGISEETSIFTESYKNKTPAHVLQVLEGVTRAMQAILRIDKDTQ